MSPVLGISIWFLLAWLLLLMLAGAALGEPLGAPIAGVRAMIALDPLPTPWHP